MNEKDVVVTAVTTQGNQLVSILSQFVKLTDTESDISKHLRVGVDDGKKRESGKLTMAEYINIEKLIALKNNVEYMWYDLYDLEDFLADVKKECSADVVEVVRCKDCRNFGEDVGMSKDGVWARCFLHKRILCENDFCSYGERKCNDG